VELAPETRDRIQQLVETHDVMLFMKGNRQQPQCGFSATVVRILDSLLPEYQTFDVLSDHEVREGVKVFSSWPTIPQLYVNGEFVGGCDIIQEMAGSGELFEALGVEAPSSEPPTIHVSDAAAEALNAAQAQHGGSGRVLHLQIESDFRTGLNVAPRGAMDVEVVTNGVTLLMDPMTARRAEGVSIDIVDTPEGQGFRIDNPNAPQVGQMNVETLKELLDSGAPFELLDVRTPEERAIASIPGGLLMTQEEAARLERLPKDTKMVFFCHTGGRSQAAAEHFIALGFHDVHNVEGGIDAWSVRIDSSVKRY
jgi:monothiol glutaredoxin